MKGHLLQIHVKRLDATLPLPVYAHEGDAGLDLYASGSFCIAPGARVLIPTGVAVAIPKGFAGFVQPRSGLALRQGLGFANSPGLIDSHYRGEIKVIAINLDTSSPIEIAHGDRIAQLVIQPVQSVIVKEVSELDSTVRGTGGFGSTGT